MTIKASIVLPLETQEDVQEACEMLADFNRHWIEQHGAPPLFATGVRYKRERQERFLPIPLVLAQGHGDCEDLAAWLAAESGGETLVVRVSSGYHVVVQMPDGSIVDPSKMLGMGS